MSEDEDPEGGRRRGDMWTRLLRVDCSSVTPADARRWLREYGNAVIIVARSASRGLSRTNLDFEDLLQIGRFAVLEAHLTYAPDNGATIRTWVGVVLRWRIGEYLQRATRPDGELLDHVLAVQHQEVTEVDEFEARMDQRELLRVLACNLALMDHRTRTIFFARLEGEGSVNVAGTLGISPCREQQIVAQSRALLRNALSSYEAAATAGSASNGTRGMNPLGDA